MKCTRWIFFFLLLTASPGYAVASDEEEADSAIVDSFFNASTLEKAGQADISLLGMSRVSVLPGTEIQGNIVLEVPAYQGERPFNLGIKHQMWQKGQLTTSFSNVFFSGRIPTLNQRANFLGSLNGIISSLKVSHNFSLNFGPYWAYLHGEMQDKVEGLPLREDFMLNTWIGYVGAEFWLNKQIFAAIHLFQSLAGGVNYRTSNFFADVPHNKVLGENTVAFAALGARFTAVDFELLVVPREMLFPVNIGTFAEKRSFLLLPNIVWRLR